MHVAFRHVECSKYRTSHATRHRLTRLHLLQGYQRWRRNCLRRLIMTVCPVLDNLGIDHWCDFGTLLGEAHSKHKAYLQNERTTYQQLHAVYLLHSASGWQARSACAPGD